MLFEDYVNNEMYLAGMIVESLVKAGKDIVNGKIRNKHIETSRADREIQWVDGVPIEKPYLRPEELNRTRAQSRFGQKKRNAKMELIQQKRKRAFARRRAMNIQYSDNERLNNVKSQLHRDKPTDAKKDEH